MLYGGKIAKIVGNLMNAIFFSHATCCDTVPFRMPFFSSAIASGDKSMSVELALFLKLKM